MQVVDTIDDFVRLLRRHDERMRPIVDTVNLFGTAPSLAPRLAPSGPLALPPATDAENA
jgi:hypothetical protein